MKSFDLTKMKIACQLAAETLRATGEMIRPGITTDDINRYVHNFTINRGGYPAPLNYRGFPKSVCTSVNDVVCHGIPGSTVLRDGDIINVDVTIILDGHFGDTNATFFVGDVDPKIKRFVALTEQAMHTGIKNVRPGAPLNDVGRIIQATAESSGYGVVKEFGGHGIGTHFHTKPHVSHYDVGEDVLILQPGIIFTIEPMINMGQPDIVIDPDGWTVRTKDGSLSCQFEHTILVTDDGHEILTKLSS